MTVKKKNVLVELGSASVAQNDSTRLPNRHVSEKDAIRWVAEHLAVESVKKEDAPSHMAWALFVDVKFGSISRQEFWGLWAKLLPTKAQLEREEDAADSNEKLHDLIDELLAKLAEDEKKVEGGEGEEGGMKGEG
jgi:hypothetical protein